MNKTKNRTLLALGGNKGEVMKTFMKAEELLRIECGKIISGSSVYKTEAWGYHDQPPFLNRVFLAETFLDPEELYDRIAGIEKKLGKEKEFENGPRAIDIDILFYNDLVINTQKLTIPHPRMHLRKFNIIPAAELLPDFIHPVLQKTLGDLALDVNDSLDIIKLQDQKTINES